MPFLNDQKVLVAGQVARSRDDTRRYLMLGLARTAERGILDSVFLPDSPGVAEFRSGYLPGGGP
jgi:hypothetical protein